MVRWSYLIFALIASFTLMMVGIFSESVRFNQLSNLENPFADIDQFSEEELDETPVLDYFLWGQKILQKFANTKLDVQENILKLTQGKLVASTQFAIDAQNFETPDLPFSAVTIHKSTDEAARWIRLGPLYLEVASSTVLIERNPEESWSKIQTTDHQIAIYFEGSTAPVILPSQSQAWIYDAFIHDKTNLLTYSKLKKEWGIRAAEDDLDLQKFHLFAKTIMRKSRYYAQDLPKTWMWGEPGSFIDEAIQGVKKAQSIYSFGYTQTMEYKRKFLSLLQPFLQAQNALYKDPEVVQKKSQEALRVVLSDEWKDLMSQSPAEYKRWSELELYQNIWLQKALKDSNEWPFKVFWRRASDISPTWESQLLADFIDLERLIFQQNFVELYEQVVFLDQKISEFSEDFSPSQRDAITRVRRQVYHMIRNRSHLKDIRFYRFYSTLVRAEISSEKRINTEIQLENAQDIIALVQFILKDSGNQDYFNTLLDLYQEIDVLGIQKKLGRNIFSPQELETIKLIKSIGETGLTPDEIEIIRQKNLRILALKKEAEDTIKVTLPEKSGPQVSPKVVIRIDLESWGFDTSEITIEAVEGNYLYLIKNLIWEGTKMEALLNIHTSKFVQIKLPDGPVFRHLGAERLIDQLSQIEDLKAAKNHPSDAVTSAHTFVAQSTPQALLIKKIIEQKLASEDFLLSRKHIEAVDTDYEHFRINAVPYGRYFRVSFYYRKSSESISDVIIDSGTMQFTFPGPYTHSTFLQMLEEESRAILLR